jgi:hypothetical protein
MVFHDGSAPTCLPLWAFFTPSPELHYSTYSTCCSLFTVFSPSCKAAPWQGGISTAQFPCWKVTSCIVWECSMLPISHFKFCILSLLLHQCNPNMFPETQFLLVMSVRICSDFGKYLFSPESCWDLTLIINPDEMKGRWYPLRRASIFDESLLGLQVTWVELLTTKQRREHNR